MTGLNTSIVHGAMGGLALILIYGLSLWRIFKSNPGDEFIESGAITIMVFVVALAAKNPANPRLGFKLLDASTSRDDFFVRFLRLSAGVSCPARART
jgi:hypothetical protein